MQIPQETGASCDFDRSQSEVAAFCEADGLIVLVLSAFMSLLVVSPAERHGPAVAPYSAAGECTIFVGSLRSGL